MEEANSAAHWRFSSMNSTVSRSLAARDQAPGDDSRLHRRAELGYLARPRPPDAVPVFVLDAMLEREAQRPQPERLAENVGVDRDVAHERVLFALLDHLVELIDQHVAELAGAVLAVHDRGRIVDLDRVGNRKDRPGARPHPDRLVVAGPVHEVGVTRLLEKIGRHRSLVGAGAHPSRGAFLLVAGESLGRLADKALFVGLPQPAQVLRIGAAVGDDLVPARAYAREDLRRVVVEQAVGVVRERQLQLVCEVEQAPDADAVAVVAPGIVALRLRLARLGVVVPEPRAEGEALDVGGDAECQALAPRPGIILALGDRNVVVERVPREKIPCHAGGSLAQSALAPESLTIFPSFTTSARIWAENSSGVLMIGVAPWVAKKSRIPGESMTFANSAFARSTTSLAMPAGPMRPL